MCWCAVKKLLTRSSSLLGNTLLDRLRWSRTHESINRMTERNRLIMSLWDALYRWTKKRSHYMRPLRLTTHIFKTPEPICTIFDNFNAVLFWTHLLTVFPHQIYNINCVTWQKSATGFRFRRLLWDFSIQCWTEPVWISCWINQQQQCIERRENAGRQRSAWTAANVVHVYVKPWFHVKIKLF